MMAMVMMIMIVMAMTIVIVIMMLKMKIRILQVLFEPFSPPHTYISIQGSYYTQTNPENKFPDIYIFRGSL